MITYSIGSSSNGIEYTTKKSLVLISPCLTILISRSIFVVKYNVTSMYRCHILIKKSAVFFIAILHNSPKVFLVFLHFDNSFAISGLVHLSLLLLKGRIKCLSQIQQIVFYFSLSVILKDDAGSINFIDRLD